VVVANDFKAEAQEDIERVSAENAALRDQLARLRQELERARSAAAAAAAHQQQGDQRRQQVSPDVKARMVGYLTSVESSCSNGGFVQPAAKPKLSSSGGKMEAKLNRFQPFFDIERYF